MIRWRIFKPTKPIMPNEHDHLRADVARLQAENQLLHQFYKRSCERYDELVAEVNKLHATAIAATKAAYVAGGVKSPN